MNVSNEITILIPKRQIKQEESREREAAVTESDKENLQRSYERGRNRNTKASICKFLAFFTLLSSGSFIRNRALWEDEKDLFSLHHLGGRGYNLLVDFPLRPKHLSAHVRLPDAVSC